MQFENIIKPQRADLLHNHNKSLQAGGNSRNNLTRSFGKNWLLHIYLPKNKFESDSWH